MKKIQLIIMAVVLLTSCAEKKEIKGITYQPYGLLNEQSIKVDSVCYQMNIGSAAWGALLIETVIVPIYAFGYDLYEPISLKHKTK